MRSVPIISIVFLTAFALLVWWCIENHAPKIEEDIALRTNAALEAAGVGSLVELEVSGLDVTLQGTVGTAEQKTELLEIAQSVEGVRKVHDQIELQPMATRVFKRPQFEAAFDGVRLILEGTVKNSATKASLVGAARFAMDKAPVIDRIQILQSTPENWENLLKLFFPILSELRSGKFVLLDTKITLAGTVNTTEEKNEVARQINTLLNSQQGFTSRVDIATLETSGQRASNCQQMFDQVLENRVIEFATGSARISEDSYPLLDQLVETTIQCSDVAIEIQGHTDSVGDEERNLELSQQRATAVLNYLAGEGVNMSQLDARGYGEAEPIAANDTQEGRARNRRIRFVTVGD